MKCTFACKKISLNDSIKEYAAKKISKLDRYLQGELPNIFNPALETGALMDLGVYCVYPALALFGKPESFSLRPHIMESGADGAGIATLRYPDSW